LAKPGWFWAGKTPGGGIAHLAAESQWSRAPAFLLGKTSGTKRPDPAGDDKPEYEVWQGDGQNLGSNRDHRHINDHGWMRPRGN